nr:uncharacterized protein CTRU02_06302 [Colletotrichum truncatum]KAF6792806.1 hypothetical protein CTRU02_06302 [Colletotrichum truncatum]
MHSTSTFKSHDGGWQLIHCNLVRSPRALSNLLTKLYGEGKFEIETRQSLYRIRAHDTPQPLDLELPEVRDCLNGKIIE